MTLKEGLKEEPIENDKKEAVSIDCTEMILTCILILLKK